VGPGTAALVDATDTKDDLLRVAAALQKAGCIAAREEAVELLAAARSERLALRELVARRCAGEPLAWLVGAARFCGERVSVRPGVYVPRPQSEALAHKALSRLPKRGLAVDLCTGSGAIAVVLARARPEGRVLATEIDPLAAACARGNGVAVFLGDMAAPLPEEIRGQVDVVTAVVPYVPSDELPLLARDVVAYEPRRALDGGVDGSDLLKRAVLESVSLLRPGGSLLLELGGREADLLAPLLAENGYWDVRRLRDEEDDLRGLVCRR
jgi:release factor glutamine methyltransferase